MDFTLEELCKQMRLSGVYSYVQEYSPDNDDLQDFLMSALQAEIDKRRMSRQMNYRVAFLTAAGLTRRGVSRWGLRCGRNDSGKDG